jgi:hypothetical protein
MILPKKNMPDQRTRANFLLKVQKLVNKTDGCVRMCPEDMVTPLQFEMSGLRQSLQDPIVVFIPVGLTRVPGSHLTENHSGWFGAILMKSG